MPSARQFCTFSVDGLLFGVDIRSVQEVLRHHEMTRVPTASPFVRGLINLRGQIVLAIDLRLRLGLDPTRPGAGSIHVIIRAVGMPVSLLVDDVGDILDLDPATMEPAPETIREAIRGFLDGIHKLPGRLLLILNAERLADFDAAAGSAA